MGGWGLKRFGITIGPFLAKWLWRFGREQESLWRKVVVARFGVSSRWESREGRGRHGCGIWKSSLAVKSIFWESIRFKLGEGSILVFGMMYGWVRFH